MPDYFNAKIYKIIPCEPFDEGDIYIGSTTNQLDKRLIEHEINYHKIFKKNMFSSEKLFNKYGFENCRIELIEQFPCNSFEVLCKRENEIIRKMRCINKL
jgi:hypothetical protein